MKLFSTLIMCAFLVQSAVAADGDKHIKSYKKLKIDSEIHVIARSAFSDRMMFTCNVAGTDIDPFIFILDSQKILHPQIFKNEGSKKIKNQFVLKGSNDEYILLERRYKGTRHRATGEVKELVYIQRYASKIDRKYAVRAKSMVYVNNELMSGNDGRCDIVERLF